jgi:cell wall-associated NlpC family hydrolase
VSDAPLVGAAVTTYGVPLGVRLSGALGTHAFAGGGSPGADGTIAGARPPLPWSVDADVVLSTAAIPLLRTMLGGLDLGAFTGIGGQGLRGTATDSARSALVASYGGMLSYPLLGPLSVETEARRRTPLSLQSTTSAPSGFERAWEYRVGLSFSFGGRGGASAGRVRFPSSGGRTVPGAPASASAARVLNTADDYLGTRYVYGGITPDGFDCSGFVQYVFRKHAVTLPRTSRQQAQVGQSLSARVTALRPGDLMMFASNGSRIDHVAIYAGNNRIIHSSSSGGGVRFDDLSTSRGRWFVEHFTTARRVLADGTSLVSGLEAAFRIADALDSGDRAPRP